MGEKWPGKCEKWPGKWKKWSENGISGHFSHFPGHVSPFFRARPKSIFRPFSSPFWAGGPKWIYTRSTGFQLWEDDDCRQVYRRVVACPILRDMINTARLYPGGQVKIIEAKAIPPVTEPPKEVTIYTVTVMLHRFLITARELEIINSLVSGDYLVSMTVTGSCANTGTPRFGNPSA